jgi:chemotaxis protein methyltransferase CheR
MTSAAVAQPIAGGIANYDFTDADFAVIAKRAQADFGLHLTVAKKNLVYSRLTKRLRQLGLNDFQTYCRMIEAPDADAERMEMLSALTTNVTHFFREEHHFDTLREKVLPPLIATAKSGKRVRLWSAGCSAGQEPYSLAFTLLGICPDARAYDIRILATDVDPVILARAKSGNYDEEEIKSLPQNVRSQYTTATEKGRITVGERARELISFGELNLMQDWPIRGPFDVIFCRNVAIYFDKETQATLWSRFADLLTPGGHLCIGHSERVAGPAMQILETVGVTTYRKVGSRSDVAKSAENPKPYTEGIPR